MDPTCSGPIVFDPGAQLQIAILLRKTAPFQRTLFVFFSGPDQEEEKPRRAPRCISITIVAVLRARSLAWRSHGILWLYKKPEKGHASERNEKTGGTENRKTEETHTENQKTEWTNRGIIIKKKTEDRN